MRVCIGFQGGGMEYAKNLGKFRKIRKNSEKFGKNRENKEKIGKIQETKQKKRGNFLARKFT